MAPLCTQKQLKKCFTYIKLTNQLSFETYFQQVDQHTGGKWLINGTKHHKGSQLQSLKDVVKVKGYVRHTLSC